MRNQWYNTRQDDAVNDRSIVNCRLTSRDRFSVRYEKFNTAETYIPRLVLGFRRVHVSSFFPRDAIDSAEMTFTIYRISATPRAGTRRCIKNPVYDVC